MKIERIASALGKSGLRTLLGKAIRWSGLLCLNYHRIGSAGNSLFDHGLWSSDERSFRDQLRFVKRHFDVIGLEDLPKIAARRNGRYALITFDDGYVDNYTAAFPILQEQNARAVFFVTTGFLDDRRISWWDEIAWMVRSSTRSYCDGGPFLPGRIPFDEPKRERAVWRLLRAYKAMPYDRCHAYLEFLADATGSGRWKASESDDFWMTWNMLREMRKAGMAIGAHTVSHPILANMPQHEQHRELHDSCRRVAEELGEPVLCFSYPVGGRSCFNDDTRDCLREIGVKYGFSYYGGINRFMDWDPYDLRRIAVESDISRDFFRAMVTMPYLFARPREPLRR